MMRAHQRGLTLVELLVAVALSTVIALAAIAALVVSRRGFSTVDAASEMRDNARFASSMLQRITAQAGFLDWHFALQNRDVGNNDLPDPPPNVSGFNNAFVKDDSNPVDQTINNNRSGACNTEAAAGCSDILIVRYQAQSISDAKDAPSTAASDASMIDCSGRPVAGTPVNRDDQAISIFHVASYRGEPTLMCSYGVQKNQAGVLSFTWQPPVPVVSGVENFQVLYGTDGVNPGEATLASTADSVPDRYLRADQMDGGTPELTNQNWRRVRSVRIGMVLRGPNGSAQEIGNTQPVYPFGLGKESSSGTEGYAMSSTADQGSRYTPPRDSRLRQTSTFTIYLHNDQGLCMDATCTVQKN